MAVRIQFRRGTAAEWTSANPTLAPGELGYEIDTAKFKLGDGSTAWTSLNYGGINQSDIDNAVANVIDLAPGTLDTLNELAASIGDDSDFANTVQSNIQAAEANAQSYANSAASSAQANAQSYADTAIANLVDSSPATLDTLNELAAALGDDPNFATSIATNLSTKMEFVADTSANFTAANVLTVANTLYVELDVPGYIRIGDGVTHYNDLAWAGKGYTDTHNLQTINVHGIADTSDLVVTSQLDEVSNSLTDHAETTTSVHGIANTALLATTADITTHASTTLNVHGIPDTSELVTNSDLAVYALTDNTTLTGTVSLPTTTSIGDVSADEISYLDGVTSGIQGQLDLLAPISTPTFTGTVTLPGDTAIGDVSADEIAYLNGVSSALQTQIDAKLDSVEASTTYAPIANASLTGTVSLPTDTSIGNVSSTELAYLDGITSDVQTQLDGKLAISAASTTYAPLADATLTGTVSLPATTSIGDVTATELGYLDATSSIQTQLDAKLASADASTTYAPIDSPTFTTSAILPASTDIGNVTATEISYLEGVTSGLQAQIDAKAALAGATFTGSVEAQDVTVTGNLVVQGTTSTISTSDLKVKDNMIYLNQAGASVLTGAVGDGTNVVYTTAEAHGYDVGDDVTVANTTPSSFDIASPGYSIIAVTDTTFTVASTVTDTYVSGGTARGKVHSNPDLGWAAGRYDTVNGDGYAHAGVFRDASDGVFKFFDGYAPEPDESVFIDTTDNTFALAPLEVAEITAANVVATTGVVFPDSTVQTSAGVPSLTGFTEKTASYTLDTLDHQDNVVEVNSSSATTFTIPTNAALAWPVGASMDILQTGSGQVTISPDSGVTLNYTPGNKLRTQWSSCTIMKRATDSWIVYGDLTA